MSKQQGHPPPSAEYYSAGGEDYGFAARLPQGVGHYQTDGKASGAAGPAPAYSSSSATGYPVRTPAMDGGMAGPVGMGMEDPLSRRDRKRAKKRAKKGGGRRKSPILMIFGGPVVLLVGLARRVIRVAKNHHGEQSSPGLARHPGTAAGNQPPY